jgi:ABC-2 type transport system ATP-binding protein
MSADRPLSVAVTGLMKRFGTIEAVRGVDLAVHAGELFGLLGPDGAGKTTLIRMLVGIMVPTAGAGAILGHDLHMHPEAIKNGIGYMSQRFSLYGDLTVAENIDYFAEIYEVPRSTREQRETEVLDFSRLAPFRRRLAQDLSGGMKQKLALACTLMHRPELLFLDEPTTGVDPVSRRDLWKILHRLVADGITIVVSTPNMDEAERCGRLALMDRGRILREGTPAELKASMPGRLLEIRDSDQRLALAALRSIPCVSNARQFGDRLHALVDTGDGADRITNALATAGLNDVRVAPVAPGLEDVFVALIDAERRSEVSADA